ncbi:hypothetical protein HYV87_01515 [Candidatus Woesearchaeota archaeon]|nr:hypothetical protein [Candidatus Woesearchaeota archaeon]MBI2581790.1 hypothetical protein [Candidatus Woesearchaeota archaeon]
MNIQELLKLRKEQKRKGFVVKESNFAAKIKTRWRYPYGRHSKVRQMHCGRPAMPNPGYGAPSEVRGLHLSGLEMVVVHNQDQLLAVNPQVQGVIIGSGVGKKKRLSLLELAQQKDITILNVKDAAASAKTIKADFEKRKELRKKKLVEASKKEEEKKKKAEEKAKKEATKEKGHKHDHDHDHDHVKEQEEEQKEMAEKTIIKPQ